MSLHDCPHTFAELATSILPDHMRRMRESMQRPWEMTNFSSPGIGVGRILKSLNLNEDFSGCYVLLDGRLPIYVGISRGVIGRLRQHVFGKTHFDANLAFRIAIEKHPNSEISRLTRANAMMNESFGVSFAEAQAYLRSLNVASIAIPNPLVLYVFEAYCAIELDTHRWNSFETH
jgi:hypothetical protein